MPHSGPEFENMLRSIVVSAAPLRVLDVGTGAGKIGALCKAALPACSVIGVEAHFDYSKQFADAWAKYERVHIDDASAWSLDHASARFDLVIFGDVLEHMWLEQAMGLLRFWSDRSKTVVAIWPNGYAQDAHAGVLSEIHRCEIRLSDIVGANLDVVRYHKHYRNHPGASKSIVVLKGRVASQVQAGVAY